MTASRSISPTAEAADALSTGFAVSPPELVGDITASLTDVAVIATGQAGDVSVILISTACWRLPMGFELCQHGCKQNQAAQCA